ncbi:hypothetical protein NDU88_006333 [Pleurodeles waltl]|uniref:Uncharacterized protein n=1 Tax=Pleurodeles waltl TaxID=8319 RepID=A0AAV7X0F9_PLEWA|nr:hypothetical protein NDU88_006333 [Pleurodeles waltl]
MLSGPLSWGKRGLVTQAGLTRPPMLTGIPAAVSGRALGQCHLGTDPWVWIDPPPLQRDPGSEAPEDTIGRAQPSSELLDGAIFTECTRPFR